MANANELLTGLLRDVSRSFYLTMRVLPGDIRPQISLAYLLARTTDTVADTQIIPVQKRLELLRKFRERILGKNNTPLPLNDLAQNQGSPSERLLLERSEDILSLLSTHTPEDQQRIRDVLNTITNGQELDLIRFAHANEKRILALQSDGELDGYTYRVAGCVGEFWTKLCRAKLLNGATIDDNYLIQNGAKFGKGLQLLNILRDLPRDLRQGRCYLPKEKLTVVGLTPEDLLKPENESKLRPVYGAYLKMAGAYLAAGWDYTNAIPKKHWRLRLACAWPALIGVKTLRRLQKGAILDPSQTIKLSRSEVRSIIIRSLIAYPFDSSWQRQFNRE